ncbi:hypothetical protein OG394_09185 [Kribbella sp. NBC_01245]|uniref:hypothetical protein n=1 Tax=Kribbella sp. NBC_01245 TaxID=2903578 RepID=UPI002E2CA710|nr:hypothetical protein [Kribbella sp. NBC_01245]
MTVAPITANHFGSVPAADQVNMATEQQIASSMPVLTRAATALTKAAGQDVQPAELADTVTVISPKDSLALIITATATDGDLARRRADAVGDSYLTQRRSDAETDVKAVLKTVDSRIAAVTAALRKIPVDRPDASAARAQLVDLQAQRDALASAAVVPGRVASPAHTPTTQAAFGPAIFAVGGLVLGLFVAVPLALMAERLRRKVGSRARLTELLDGAWVAGDGKGAAAAAIEQAVHQPALLRSGGRTSPVVAAVLDVTGRNLAAALTEAAGSEGWEAKLVDAPSLQIAEVYNGRFAGLGVLTPKPDVLTTKAADKNGSKPPVLLVVDLTDGPTHTRSAAIAARASMVLVAATRTSSARELSAFAARLGDATRHVDGALLVPPTDPATTPVSASVGASATTPIGASFGPSTTRPGRRRLGNHARPRQADPERGDL